MKLVLFIHWWWHNEVAQYFGKYVEKSCKNSYILWCSFFHFGDLLFRKRYCVPMVFTTELLRVKIQKQEQRSRKLVGASQVVLMVKNPPASAEDRRDAGLMSGRPPWRRAWPPAPGLLPGESHGQRSLAGYSPWGHIESDTTQQPGTHARGAGHTGSSDTRPKRTRI